MTAKKDPTRDALKALTVAGRGPEVTDYLTKTADDLSRRYAATTANKDLNELGRNRQLARTYRDARAQVEAELARRSNTAILRDRSDASSVLGVQGLSGDPQMLQMSMRQANDKVAEINDARELSELLRRATRQGDEVMARAVAARALELRVDGPLHQFIEDRPELDGAVERLWRGQEAEHDTMHFSTLLYALKPPELSGTPSWEIDRLADMPDAPDEPEPFHAANPNAFIEPPSRPNDDYANTAADLFGPGRGY